MRIPLYSRVLLWFSLNLLLLLVLGFFFMRAQFKLGLDWFLSGPTGERIEMLADQLTSELRFTPEANWPSILTRYEASSGITLALFGNDGTQKLGSPLTPTETVRTQLIDRRSASDLPPPPRPKGKNAKEREPKARDSSPPKPRFIMRSEVSPQYWAGIHLSLAYGEGTARRPLTLVMVTDSLSGNGFFFDPWPWAALAAGGLLLSALIWLPVVSGMTRAIRRLNDASKHIASGEFGVRVPDERQDELGELASSVNTMAAQLSDYVDQQRRITADVAHELCSPIARMQMALGVIEQRGSPEQEAYLKKVDAELQHMAKLVEEVMTFSKAETIPEREAPQDIALLPLIETIIARDGNAADFLIDISASLTLHSLREALDRALGNVIRNAVRYAAHAGPIEIRASTLDNSVILMIADHGPGVPADALPRLFEPFYRPEAARARHTGGSGLGLAIVQRCIAACGGTVAARLRKPQGLIIELHVPKGQE